MSMSDKMHVWIDAQISERAPGKSDVRVVTELADAAATLKGTKDGQVFGLAVKRESIPTASALGDRCLSVLDDWFAHLTPSQADELGDLLERLDLRASTATTEPIAQLFVYTDAHLENCETGETVADPELVARFVGARARSPLDGLPCLVDAMGGEDDGEPTIISPNGPQKGWWLGGEASLVQGDRGTLRCKLSLDLAKIPSTEEIERILSVIESDVFFSSWGLNLDWDLAANEDGAADDLVVHVDDKPIAHRIDARAH